MSTKIDAVREFMADGRWCSIREVELAVGMTGSGASAAMRALRKPQHGGYVLERKHVQGSFYVYRLGGKQDDPQLRLEV